ncbi:MAG: SMC-Scp complex subunit ScpB [Candidatus Woesearchaeota archaeon]
MVKNTIKNNSKNKKQNVKDTSKKIIKSIKNNQISGTNKNNKNLTNVEISVGKKNLNTIDESKDDKNITSLKEMEEKILEKYEEQKPILEIKEDIVKEAKEVKKLAEIDISKNPKDYKARVEAILFAVGKYLDEENISQLCDIDKRNTKKALEELKKDYDSHDTALMIVQEGESWKINVREKYLSLVRKIVADTELSKSIMETLAVIAWKNPVYQNAVVNIRGNKCYDHIEELVNAGFITKDKKGRSYLLKTTEKFYNYFDIDQKNLQGVMNEAKMPIAQTTLEDIHKPEEQTYSREKLLQALETIETKKIVYNEEDKDAQKQFLDNIHKKIEEAAKRTDEVVADIPRPAYQQEQPSPAAGNDEVPPELHNDAIVENEDEIVIDTGVANGEHHFQKPEEQRQKLKQLTKKQLEKKFKEELQRVKDKPENKK